MKPGRTLWIPQRALDHYERAIALFAEAGAAADVSRCTHTHTRARARTHTHTRTHTYIGRRRRRRVPVREMHTRMHARARTHARTHALRRWGCAAKMGLLHFRRLVYAILCI